YLSFLFDRFLEPLLVHVRRRASHALSTCEIALVASTCALLESLLLSTQFQGHPGAEGTSLKRHRHHRTSTAPPDGGGGGGGGAAPTPLSNLSSPSAAAT
ncbi:hypothetical protein Vretimale_6723, partial [Volvox reticuliferus]